MPASASTPATALRRLTELSGEVRAAVLLGPDGALLAFEPKDRDLGESLRELTLAMLEGADAASGDPPAEIEVATQAGTVFAVRRVGATVAAVAGRLALSSLMRYDLGELLAGLEPGGHPA